MRMLTADEAERLRIDAGHSASHEMNYDSDVGVALPPVIVKLRPWQRSGQGERRTGSDGFPTFQTFAVRRLPLCRSCGKRIQHNECGIRFSVFGGTYWTRRPKPLKKQVVLSAWLHADPDQCTREEEE